MRHGVPGHQRAVSQVRNWLKASGPACQAVSAAELMRYGGGYSRGWNVIVAIDGTEYGLHLLLPQAFPLVRPRVALVEPDKFLKWPHIEENGLLCLPYAPLLPSQPDEMAREALEASCALIEKCLDQEYRNSEFRREFVSYWNRTCAEDSTLVWSLLGNSAVTKQVSALRLKNRIVVAEAADEIAQWYAHRFQVTGELRVEDAVRIVLPEGIVATDVPTTAEQFFEWVQRQSPQAYSILVNILATQANVVVVVSCHTMSGIGNIAVELSANTRDLWRGFRPTTKIPFNVALNRWRTSAVVRLKVERFDAAWVHGRDGNDQVETLARASVTLIGVGSLGSIIAIALAQAGVGNMVLIDHDEMRTENVGRHALGVQFVGLNKATAMRAELLLSLIHI